MGPHSHLKNIIQANNSMRVKKDIPTAPISKLNVSEARFSVCSEIEINDGRDADR